ncbi:hypothetical protein PG996_008002 [Apiospora saccharicola]|uniref:Thioesterase domain-containing protein n=1 Tax=Apiospora saccharicola TaxID=335842 RepID=A0ABR1UZ60_9PEZI
MVVAKPQRVLVWGLPESQEAFEYFSNIDWCRHLLSTPGLHLFKLNYQNRKAHGWDPVVSGILARRDAAGIQHFLSTLGAPGTFPPLDTRLNAASAYGLRPALSATTEALQNKMRVLITDQSRCLMGVPKSLEPPTIDNEDPFPQHVNFYALGTDLAGIPHTVHGGIIALLIDSAFAQLGFMHADPHVQFYSAFTNVRFLRPLIIPPPAPRQQKEQQEYSKYWSHLVSGAATVVNSPNRSSSGSTIVGDDRHVPVELFGQPGGGMATVIVRAQIDSLATKEGESKMHVLAQVETEGGVVCAIGEGLLLERIWKSNL